jgi:hypothetical protein
MSVATTWVLFSRKLRGVSGSKPADLILCTRRAQALAGQNQALRRSYGLFVLFARKSGCQCGESRHRPAVGAPVERCDQVAVQIAIGGRLGIGTALCVSVGFRSALCTLRLARERRKPPRLDLPPPAA